MSATSWARTACFCFLVCWSAASVAAQTVIKLPKNKYTPQQDVEIGRQAAAEVRKQYPIISDDHIAGPLCPRDGECHYRPAVEGGEGALLRS